MRCSKKINRKSTDASAVTTKHVLKQASDDWTHYSILGALTQHWDGQWDHPNDHLVVDLRPVQSGGGPGAVDEMAQG